MQVSNVTSGIVSASNGGCDAFDINRSLAAGVTDLNPDFSKLPLSTLALSIIATQSAGHSVSSGSPSWIDFMPPGDKKTAR